MDKCPKCGGEVKVLTRSLEFWGGMDCVAVENRDSLQQLKAEIAVGLSKIELYISTGRGEYLEDGCCYLRQLSAV